VLEFYITLSSCIHHVFGWEKWDWGPFVTEKNANVVRLIVSEFLPFVDRSVKVEWDANGDDSDFLIHIVVKP
jgi:hypothetical protein